MDGLSRCAGRRGKASQKSNEEHLPCCRSTHPDKPFHRIKRQAQYTRCRALDQQRGYDEERKQREQQRAAAER